VFCCPIALVRVESILWEILVKITHHTVTYHLRNYRGCCYLLVLAISSDFVVDLYLFSTIHFYVVFFLPLAPCETVSDAIIPYVEYIVVTSVNIYLYRVCCICVL
jgi:hypothetical protein